MFGFILCLFHAHQWGRLAVFYRDGSKKLYEECGRCHILRKAVI